MSVATTNLEPNSLRHSPAWMRSVLLAAAVYNVVWGAAIILFPNALFDWTGMVRPLYPQLWQCVGMIVGVYGAAYGIASLDPVRHWPVVFAGLLGKVLGPIGFVSAVLDGVFPAVWGITILANDLAWWVPFFLILRHAYTSHMVEDDSDLPELSDALEDAVTQSGASLAEVSDRSPILLIFLRHFGCTFCRETLADVVLHREELAASGSRIVLVHMSPDEEALNVLAASGLEDLDRVSDPDRVLYRAAGLRRGSLGELFGLRVWWRGFRAGLVDRNGIGFPSTDPFQMPGVFLIQDRKVVRAFQYVHAGERPNYAALSACEASNERMKQDLERAADVQRTLLPSRLPKVAGGTLAWKLEPTDELAGDTLNVVRLDEHHLAMYVLDVSGHGVSSALLSVTLNHWLSPDKGQSGLFTKGTGERYRIVAPDEVARKLNRQFPMDSGTAQYFTLLYGILDTRTFAFRYVTAGHPPPILLPSSGSVRQLPGTGVPVGLLKDADYKEHQVMLDRGDRLYLFSDGMFEAGNQEGEEFGIERMLSSIDTSRSTDLDTSISHLFQAVQDWRSGAPFPDDLSVLSLEVSASLDLTGSDRGEVAVRNVEEGVVA